MLVGRRVEQDRVCGLLAGARQTVGGSLVVSGEPGIGKTALLDYAEAQANGMRVLRARPVESEAELAFGALLELVRPLVHGSGGVLKALSPVQRGALEAALGFGRVGRGPPEPVMVYAATLSLLAAAGEQQAVFVAVDDAQWLDAGSAAALGFVARRLGDDRVAIMFTLRSGERTVFDPAGLELLELRGLAAEDAAVVVDGVGVTGLSVDQRAKIMAAGAGNPLGLVELTRIAGEGDHVEGVWDAPVRSGRGLEAAFLRQTMGLSPAARQALLIAAACDTGDALVIARGLAAGRLSPTALDEAEHAKLVSRTGGVVEFRHPLVRSAVYHGADAADRRAAHRVLAAALIDEADLERRAWHLAASVAEPDEAAARGLEDAAEVYRKRAALAAATRALEVAADLSISVEDRVRRIVSAAVAAHLVGHLDDARRLLERASELHPGQPARSEVERLRGRIEARCGVTAEAYRILVGEAERIAVDDPDTAVALLVEAVDPCIRAGEPRRAVEIADRSAELAAGRGREVEMYAALARAAAMVFVGDSGAANALVVGAADELPPESQAHYPQLAAYLGMTLAFTESFDRARIVLTELIERGRVAGQPGTLPYPLISLAWINRAQGRWGDAIGLLHETLELTERDRRPIDRCWAESVLGWIAAAQGRAERCHAYARTQLALHADHQLPYQAATAHAALGLLALGEGDHSSAVRDLDLARRFKHDHGYFDATTHPFIAPELAEALIRNQQPETAAEVITTARAEVDECGRDSALAPFKRSQALLAADAGEPFDALLLDALERHARVGDPFAEARTQLCYGELLHRAKRRREARAQLDAAHTTFERLGAHPWVTRVDAVLERARPQVKRGRDRDELTDTELRMASLVAQGYTNKEISQIVFLSPKTVEHHLTTIFRKMNVRGRTQLTAKWTAGNTPTPPSPVNEVTEVPQVKLQTLLFTDMVSSTALIDAIGDPAWHDLVRWHDRTLREIFHHHHGREVDHAGDGFFVVFEDPRDAISASVAIQQSLAEHRTETGFAPRIRIGLHTCETTTDHGAVRGKGVHVAARIMNSAAAGEIIASQSTLANIASNHPLSEPQTLSLKGLQDPITVVAIDWATSPTPELREV